MQNRPDPPVLDPNAPLAKYWDAPLHEVATVPLFECSPEDAERHRICCQMVMALVAGYWNGNKRGAGGDYPWRPNQQNPGGLYQGGDYLGHNIACIAVDGNGSIMDFDFNHNEILNSSAEHAEARLVCRVFSLNQLYRGWATRAKHDQALEAFSRLAAQPAFNAAEAAARSGLPPMSLPPKSVDYMSVLSDVTVYTSLESCAQCSGIMALGKVKAVVYVQRDYGMYAIGNLMRNLTTDALRAPLPIPASDIGLPYFDQLNDGFRAFFEQVQNTPFWINGDKVDKSPSITSFLCTDTAKQIVESAATEFGRCEAAFPEFRPRTEARSNQELLTHARDFLEYAVTFGDRGTAHS